MAKHRTKKGQNGRPFAYVSDTRVDHLAGDWTNPVESLLDTRRKDD